MNNHYIFKILICLLALSISPAFAEDKSDNLQVLSFERVIDGDTFIASGRKIRLWGIDAPEKDHPSSYAATIFLEGLLKEGTLKCKFIEKDRYQRDVMHCFTDGLDIGSMMVQVGMAEDYEQYSGRYYDFEENLARTKKVGIWRNTVSDNF